MIEYINSFLLSNSLESIEKGKKVGVKSFTVATDNPLDFENSEGVEAYKIVRSKSDTDYPRLCLTSLSDDKIVDAVTEKVLGEGAKLIVFCSYSLGEIGSIEARFHLTPVQLLHKLGLLDGATLVGGVYLDRDDIDLIAQANAKVVLCPTCSLGYGYGVAHLRAMLGKIEVGLGSGDNAFNGNGDMVEELKTLYLSTCADMREREVISYEELFSLASKNAPTNLKSLLFN